MTLAIATVIAMYGAFLAVGWLASRKVRGGTAADLIVAGRQMPFWVAALTMTATWVDGGYLLGTTEGAYKDSIQLGVQGGLCFGLSLVLGGAFFAGIMRRHGFTTLIDPFEARFGRRWAAVPSPSAKTATCGSKSRISRATEPRCSRGTYGGLLTIRSYWINSALVFESVKSISIHSISAPNRSAFNRATCKASWLMSSACTRQAG